MLTRNKIAIASVEIVLKQLIAILTIIALARILQPSDYGEITPIYILIAISTGLIDFGIGSAIVRFKELGHEGESTAFWINISVAIFIVIVMLITSSFAALYFDNEKLQIYIYIISISIAFSSIGSIQQYILLRDKKFHKLLQVGLLSSISASIISVFMAYKGYGPYALIMQIVIANMVSAAAVWAVSDWRPLFLVDFIAVRKLLHFGLFLTLTGIVNALYKSIASSLILKSSGVRQAGLFYNADRIQQYLSDFIVSLSSRLAFTSFVGDLDLSEKNKLFVASLKLLCFITCPIFFGLYSVSENIVQLTLGTHWLEIVPILKTLCVVGLFWPLEVHNQNMIKANGNLKKYFLLELLKRTFGIACIILIVPNGMQSVALCISILAVVFYIANAYYSGLIIDLNVKSQLYAVLPSFISGITMSLAIQLINFDNLSLQLNVLIVKIVIGVFAYITSSYLFNKNVLIWVFINIKNQSKYGDKSINTWAG
jgi:O-antigen/teichoic acid export membrane protein